MSNQTDTFREMMMEARVERAAATERALSEIEEKVDQSEARWSEDEMREIVAHVLADSIREAGTMDRDALIRSIAPNVLSTIRSEISTSHPQIIEALSPRLGELIAAAVEKAMEGMQRQIDAAVPVDLWIAGVKAKLTGTPSTGWIVSREDGFAVMEAYLIERGSGLLLARDRPVDMDAGEDAFDDDLLSGMIAALDSFAHDAFGGSGIETLRELTLTAGTIYLRASPTKILALRCTRAAPPEVEDEIDQFLDRVITRVQEEGDGVDLTPARLLADAPKADTGETISAAAILVKSLSVMAALIALIWGHFMLEGSNTERWIDAMGASVRDDPGMSGYPVTVVYDEAEEMARIGGLVPDDMARTAIEDRLARLATPLRYGVIMPVVGQRLDE